MPNEMDDHIKEFHRLEEYEWELMCTAVRSDYSFQEERHWPKPSATDLWFEGIKRWGREFADHEYQLREENKHEYRHQAKTKED